MQGNHNGNKEIGGHKGRGEGYGGKQKGHGGGCGKHQPKQRFMETSLLVLLANQTNHGYGLLEHLKDFGFNSVNVSTLYRIMRKMEERGWVSSGWEKGDKGPQRRVYAITQDGTAALSEWIDVFKQRRANIETLLGKYGELKDDGGA